MSSIKAQFKNISMEGLMSNLIWTVAVILFIFWLLGFSINIGGGLIHLLLVLALIAIVYNLVTGRRIG
jgi:hypothetical protein